MAAPHLTRRNLTAAPALVAIAAMFASFAPVAIYAQWVAVNTGSHASFRGVSVAPDGTIWLGGTHGTVLRSTDAGITWLIDSVPGASSFDFRGVAAIDSRTAYAMVAAADTGRIYKTVDAGRSWTLQYREERKGVFLDGLECWSQSQCVAAGDPVAGHFLVISTHDGGAHWTQLPVENSPVAETGEAAFAASASSVVAGSRGRAWIVTGGGPAARVWRSADFGATWQVATTPVTAGSASAGLFSIALCPDGRLIAVGGDYRAPAGTGSHVALSRDGATWTPGDPKQTTPYLSGVACAASAKGTVMIAVGPAGSFVSRDGQRWTRTGDIGFNAVTVTRAVAIAVGGTGVISRAPLTSLVGQDIDDPVK